MAGTAPKAEVVEKLVANHRRFLEFLERRTGDRALAEDLLQEAFVRGIDRIGALRDDESAVAWFYRTLRNAVVDHHRRGAATARSLAALAREVERETPPDELEREICRCISELAETLKPEYAEVLRDVEVAGLPVKEYASRHGLSANNAGVRVFRAREALRRQVAQACGTCAEHGCYDCTCGEAPVARTDR